MHEPSGPAWLVWLETTRLAAAMREWLWLYPAVEIVHILGFVLLVGTMAMLDLRLIGITRGVSAAALASYLLPWAWVGVALIVPSGLLMFTAHATEMAANPAFQLKLALIAAAALNAGWFHRGQWRVPHAGPDALPPARARWAGGLSLLLWVGVISCGRLLAYL